MNATATTNATTATATATIATATTNATNNVNHMEIDGVISKEAIRKNLPVYRTMSIPVYFDDYEKKYGDGFYPQLERNDLALTHTTTINFRTMIIRENDEANGRLMNTWIQTSNNPIKGLDGDCGVKLLQLLNKEVDELQSAEAIFNNKYEMIYPKNRQNIQ